MTLNNTIPQLSVFSHGVIMKLLESNKLDIMNIQNWTDDIFYQTPEQSKTKKERCEICNSKEDSKCLELHHLSGRKHDYRTITVCLICHRWLTERQDTWDKRWLEVNQPENLKQAFFILGLQDVFILKSMKIRNNIYEKLGYSYNEKISVLLGRWQN